MGRRAQRLRHRAQVERNPRRDRAAANFVDNYGHGLWFDGDNHRILVDGAFSARNKMRGAYMELNPGPITLQNSTICENGFEGVANARTDNLTVNNNKIFDNAYWQVTGTGNPMS